MSLFLVLLLYHAFSYYDTQNSIVIASVRTQSRKILLFDGFGDRLGYYLAAFGKEFEAFEHLKY
jgi:hypothetical protein